MAQQANLALELDKVKYWHLLLLTLNPFYAFLFSLLGLTRFFHF